MIKKWDNPYIFISYAHADKDVVLPIINELIKNKYRVWYDDGIHLSEDWPDVVAENLMNSSLVIFMMSENFIKSQNCKRELYLSADENKNMFLVTLEKLELPFGIKLQTAGINSIFFDKNELDKFAQKLFQDPFLASLDLKMNDEEAKETSNLEVVKDTFIPNMTIAIGIVKKGNDILILKRSKPEKGLVWGFPATIVKPTDDPERRIVKEVKAETSLTTKLVKSLGSRVHPQTHTITFYYALDYVSGELINIDDDENEEAIWVSIENLKDYIPSNLFEPVSMYVYSGCEVSMCIATKGDEILLTHRKDDLGWVFPGGTIEEGENVLQAAIRELKEETNIDASKATVISARVHPKTNKFMAYIHLTDLSDDELKISDPDLDDVKWVKINEINNYFKYPIFDKVSNYLDTLNKK
ncbi:MAG: NUDIX domain-containing protein [Bacilli bacterium]|nr:NUDIX domain-containing protein [Bacilli bacterium]